MSISTHVLDAVAGRPAAGLPVELSRRESGVWRELTGRVTDEDGRIADLAATAEPGVYRLRFDVAAHFGTDTFYPEVVITFRIVDGKAHHHVPLLLSPYAYSTYRGS
ncbi:MAG TPA: hydroxyisourate hydrolase [Jatrophihabitans sp.]|nr:hydroxyisourate hydrolase [Jatrophihabitans sp.]